MGKVVIKICKVMQNFTQTVLDAIYPPQFLRELCGLVQSRMPKNTGSVFDKYYFSYEEFAPVQTSSICTVCATFKLRGREPYKELGRL